ncbi:MAG TPA: hypothetical protein VFA81_02370 [Burkholderiales bacterium]|nr:hypothetical protein [Burkholderiales bacterium]
MFGERNVNLKLSDRAKEHISELMAHSGLKSPILSIKWAKWNDEPTEHWVIGFYERERVQEGWLGKAPEFEFVVIQEWVFDSLDGKLLDIGEAGVIVE